MNPFYISDSYTINLGSEGREGGHPGFQCLHRPGVANQSSIVKAGETAVVSVCSASLEFVPFMSPIHTQGVNMDLKLGLYDVTNGPAQFLDILPYTHPYGTAPNGMLMNSVTGMGHMVPCSRREFQLPIKFLAVAPNVEGHIYQVGPAINFFFGQADLFGAYQYHVHGYWEVQP
jgi:hypothetical protein